MKFVALAALAAGCGRLDFEPRTIAAVHRKPIAIAPGSAVLVDFPVGVIVGGDPELAAGARLDGRDLAFTAADGALLDFEIESYDGATGALVAWVREPMLAGPTTAYLEYGGALDRANPEGVWPGCLGVWHMGQSGAIRDSTAGGHDFVAAQLPAHPASVAGLAGSASAFTANSSVAQADPSALNVGTRSFSVSLWVRVTQSADQYDMVLFKGAGTNLVAGYDFEIGTQPWRQDVSDGTTNVFATFGMQPALIGKWSHLVGVTDRAAGALSVYTDGALAQTLSITALGALDSTQVLELGAAAYPFSGVLDELRIYDHAVTPAWIAAEDANLADPGAFAQVGPAE